MKIFLIVWLILIKLIKSNNLSILVINPVVEQDRIIIITVFKPEIQQTDYFTLTFPEYTDLYQIDDVQFLCQQGCADQQLSVLRQGDRSFNMINPWISDKIMIYISNIKNPHNTFEDEPITLQFKKQDGTVLDEVIQYNEFEARNLENTIITQSNLLAYENTKLTISFDPVIYIPQYGSIQITSDYLNYKVGDTEIPIQSFHNSLTCKGIQNIEEDIVCAIDSNKQISILNGYLNHNSTTSTVTFEINGFINPPSLKPLNLIDIKTVAINTGIVAQIQNLQLASTQIQELRSVTIDTISNSINSLTNLKFNLEINTFLYKDSSIQIQFPVEFTNLNQQSIIYNGINNCADTTNVEFQGQILKLQNVIDKYTKNVSITFELQNVKNPDKVTTTEDFVILILDDEDYQQEKSQPGLSYKVKPGELISAELVAQNNIVGQISDYTFTFTINNGFNNLGFIEIEFPQQYVIQDQILQQYTQISKSKNISSTAKFQVQNNMYTLTQAFPNGLQQGDEIILIVQNVQNPITDTTDQNISLTTFIQQTDKNMLDQILTLDVEFQPGNIQISAYNSLLTKSVNSETIVEIIFEIQNVLPINGYIDIIIDEGDFNFNKVDQQNLICLENQFSQGTFQCNFGLQKIILTNISGNIINAGSQINIQIQNLVTPRYTKTFNNLNIRTYTDNSGLIDQSNNVPDLLIDTALLIQNINIFQNKPQLGEISNYTFELQLVNDILENDKLILTLPVSLHLQDPLNCSPVNGLSISFNCQKLNANTVQINLQSYVKQGESISFTIQNIQNPDVHTELYPFQFQFQTQNNEQIQNYNDMQGIDQLQGQNLLNLIISCNSMIINENSEMNITFKNKLDIIQNSILILQLPKYIQFLEFNVQIQGLGTEVQQSLQQNMIYLENIGDIPKHTDIEINILQLKNPDNNLLSDIDKEVNIFIHDINDNIYLESKYTLSDYLCNEACMTCYDSPLYCTSCNYNKLVFDGNCYDNCEQGMYEYQGQCLKCLTDDTTCLFCDSQEPQVCITCKQGFQLNQGACQQFSQQIEDLDLIIEQAKQQFILSDEFQQIIDENKETLIVQQEVQKEDNSYDSIYLTVYCFVLFIISAFQKKIAPHQQFFGNYLKYLSFLDIPAQLVFTYYYHHYLGRIVYTLATLIIFFISLISQFIIGYKFNKLFKNDEYREDMMKLPSYRWYKNIIVYYNTNTFTEFYPPKLKDQKSQQSQQILQNSVKFQQKYQIYTLFKNSILTKFFILTSSISMQISYLLTYYNDDYTTNNLMTFLFDYPLYLSIYNLIMITQFIYINKLQQKGNTTQVFQNPSDVELQQGKQSDQEEEQSYAGGTATKLDLTGQPTPLKKKQISEAALTDSCMSPIQSNLGTESDLQQNKKFLQNNTTADNSINDDVNPVFKYNQRKKSRNFSKVANRQNKK